MEASRNEDALVAMLLDAHKSRRTIDALPADLVPRDEAAAYRVANRVIEALGWQVGAWKIGCTAAAFLRDLGASRPIVGQITRDVIRASPCRFAFDELMTPVVECEFAFEMADDLAGRDGPWTAAAVAERVAALYPAIEIGERRLSRNQPVPILALIADNSAAGALVIGEPIADWMTRNLEGATVALRIDDAEHSRGHGRDVLGHPLEALAWLAENRALAGRPVRAGDIVSTGSCTGVALVQRGSTYVGDFGDLGRVEASFA